MEDKDKPQVQRRFEQRWNCYTPLNHKYTKHPTYLHWIEHRLSVEDPLAKCVEWCDEMKHVFRELVHVRGQVMLYNGLERDHMWLEEPVRSTPSGLKIYTIVDPTASQFKGEYYGGVGIFLYLPRNEDAPEPTGTCPNCGGWCYEGRTLCSVQCEQEYVAYLKRCL